MEEKSNTHNRYNFQINRYLILFVLIITSPISNVRSQCLVNTNINAKQYDSKDNFMLSKHDRALFHTISKRFGVEELEGFYFKDDFNVDGINNGNAIAYQPNEAPKNIIEFYGKNSFGYIGIGKNFANYLAFYDGKNYQLNYKYPFVIAHECSHIVQNNWNRFYMKPKIVDSNNISIKHKELNADYGAGLYFSVYLSNLWKKSQSGCDNDISNCKFYTEYYRIISVVQDYVCQIGDDDTESIRHHGTCEERMSNFIQGLDKYRNSQRGSIIDELERHLLKISTTNE